MAIRIYKVGRRTWHAVDNRALKCQLAQIVGRAWDPDRQSASDADNASQLPTAKRLPDEAVLSQRRGCRDLVSKAGCNHKRL